MAIFAALAHNGVMNFFKVAFLSMVLTPVAWADDVSNSLGQNGGFEDGSSHWSQFVPDDSKMNTCTFTVINDNPHSGNFCARMESSGPGRFCIGNPSIPVQPHDRYRITVWCRADAAAIVGPNSPGVSIRLNFKKTADDKGVFPDSFRQINPEGVVSIGVPAPINAALPTDWTKIEAVVEIPDGITLVDPDLFIYVQGVVFFDDFSVEKVPADTHISPVTPAP
jgi:hypothetical protein